MSQKEIKYKAGSYIYIEGDEDSDNIYILKEGVVEFQRLNNVIQLNKTKANPGDIFGFVASLSKRPRIESSLAKTDCIIHEFSADTFLSILQKNSDIAIKLINYFADELRAYDNMIFAKEEKLFPPQKRLFNLGKFYYQHDMYNQAYCILTKFIYLYPDDSSKNDARQMILDMEATGTRISPEPIKENGKLLLSDKQIIFCENEPGNELYIIHEGKVKIVKTSGNSEMILSILHRGDIFGELAIVSDKLRNATAISYGKSVLIPVNKDSLLGLMQRSPEILKKIFSAISQRVWFTYIRLESRLYEKPITRIYAFLENKLKEDNISFKKNDIVILNFGIDELLNMTGTSQEKLGNYFDILLADSNLSFNFGQITILEPKQVTAKAIYYKSRDRLKSESD